MVATDLDAKVSFGRRAWYVPNERHAIQGWLEGRPSRAQLDATVVRARQERAEWRPPPQAWDQLIQLQRFVGRSVRIQFWCDGTMWLLDESEWPDPVEGHCEGAVTLIDDGHLQAFLLLRDPINARTRVSSDSRFLVSRAAINCKLAPLADICDVEPALVAT